MTQSDTANGDTPMNESFDAQAKDLNIRWVTDARWQGITRPYTAEEVVKLRGSLRVEHSIARHGA